MKLNKLERNWILYDVGNSAFTLLVSTILPIYFNYLAQKAGLSSVSYMAYWGYAASIGTLIVALIGPILGALADTKNHKKPIFTISLIIGAISCICLGFAKQWLIFLIIFILAKVAYSSSLIFYDSMLPDITEKHRMDIVSSSGYAWGYIGSCIPFLISLLLVLKSNKLGITMETAMALSFIIISTWWVLMSCPLIKSYKQIHYIEKQPKALVSGFKRISSTLINIKQEKKIFLFLLSFFFYIDGVYTIISMATAYGSALGLNSTGLLLALLVTQIVAFPCSIIFGRLSNIFKSENLIMLCITAYLGISLFAMILSTQLQFWILAILVGMFQGGIQALSRSYYTKIIPANKSGEYFGLMDVCGKGASFLGTTIVSVVSQLTGNVNKGVGILSIMFILGMILLKLSTSADNSENTIPADLSA